MENVDQNKEGYSLIVLLIFAFCIASLARAEEVCAAAGLKFEDVVKKNEEAGGARRLNNLVLEYVNTSLEAPKKDCLDKPFKTFEIDHFRNGWMFFRLEAENGSAYISIDSNVKEDAVLVFNNSKTGRTEAMRYINKGSHTINIFTQSEIKIKRFIVRSIPLLIIQELHFAAQEVPKWHRVRIYDWEFYKKYINPNINVIVATKDKSGKEGHISKLWEPYAREWQRQGKKWLVKSSARIYWEIKKQQGDEAFEKYHWNDITKPFKEIPYIDGYAIDEWTDGGAGSYHNVARVVDRFSLDQTYHGKRLYIFGMRYCKKYLKPGIESIIRNNHVYLAEGYFFLREKAMPGDEPDHKKYIEQYGGSPMSRYLEKYPGFIQNNMAYLFATADYHSSFDVTPSLDFKVFLDMQLHHLANHEAFNGLYGVGSYVTTSTTKNTLQYASALIRHYCIEGKQERFNKDPLRLLYLKNPGFEEKTLENWKIRPANQNSVKLKLVKDLPYKKKFTNLVPPSGDKMLVTIRSDKAPNIISQKITGLKKGRLYSLTVYVSDMSDFGIPKMVPISIKLDDVEVLSKETEDREIYAHAYQGDNIDGVCWNYHYRVFRATKSTAKLTLTDWGKPDTPAGEIGHEIIWDYIKIQPYYAGDPTK